MPTVKLAPDPTSRRVLGNVCTAGLAPDPTSRRVLGNLCTVRLTPNRTSRRVLGTTFNGKLASTVAYQKDKYTCQKACFVLVGPRPGLPNKPKKQQSKSCFLVGQTLLLGVAYQIFGRPRQFSKFGW